jgi:hypothetical protein
MLPFIGPMSSSKLGPCHQASEYEAAVFADARRARQRELFLVETGSAAFRHRHRGEPAVGVEAPAVIAAVQPRRVALALVQHFGATMSAAVDQHVHAAVAVARHYYGLAPELGGNEVAGLRHLACVADEQPGAPEDPFHLQLEDVRVGINVAMDAARLDQLGDVVCVPVAHLMLVARKLVGGVPSTWDG